MEAFKYEDIPYQTNANAYKIRGVEHFTPQTNGEVSDSLTQNWTRQAVECFSLKSDCRNCSISKHGYSFICQMHKIVEQLLELRGEPRLSDFSFD